MNVVVDTNVVAYYLLASEPFVEEARQFWRIVAQPLAPALWAAELANVVWMAVRTGILAPDEGQRRLDLAGRLHVRSVSIRTLWQAALARAIASDVAVYDTLFVELAARRRLPLATFDAKILKAFPDVACRPGALVPS
ncbi:MAG: type II toxin-antitoxin system VapC family toxin [Gemmatimonadetes bacterium]|nr:type II toxin-antitoxin system VapC family toxin [Gemmatimonadota bacterium]